MSELACVVCGNRASRPAFVAEDWHLHAAAGRFRYVRCAACDTLRADPQPDDETLGKAYPATYLAPSLVDRVVIGPLGDTLGRREAGRVVHHGDRDGRLADIGCGGGIFLRRLRNAGWRGPLVGVEPSPEAGERARALVDAEILPGTIEHHGLADGSVDALVMRHVIEHVRDPRAALEQAARALAPGGVLYLATPDERALSARVFGRHWVGYDPPRHLWVFRPAALRRILEETGFETIEQRWDWAPQMWAASLRFRLADGGGGGRARERFAHPLNPLVALPGAVLGGVEVALHRSTMFGIVARRR